MEFGFVKVFDIILNEMNKKKHENEWKKNTKKPKCKTWLNNAIKFLYYLILMDLSVLIRCLFKKKVQFEKIIISQGFLKHYLI